MESLNVSDPIDEFEMNVVVSLIVDDIGGDIAFARSRKAEFETLDDGSVKIVLNERGARSLCRFLLAAQHAKRTGDTSYLRSDNLEGYFPNWKSSR